MTTYDYDYFVIGGGSGGVRSSRIAAGFGAKVAIAENHRFGGTCVIRGCVPKKLLSYASHFREEFEDAEGYGWTVGPATFSWPKLIANKDKEIARLELVYRNLLTKSGVELFESTARVVDPHTVEVGGRRVTAKYILVATGAWPRMPAIPGIEHCISSNEAFQLPELPHRVLVVGGGYIAVEFAGIFNGLGVAGHAVVSRRGDPARLRRRGARAPARGDGGKGHPRAGQERRVARGEASRRQPRRAFRERRIRRDAGRRRDVRDRSRARTRRASASRRSASRSARRGRSWSTSVRAPACRRSTRWATSPTASTSRRSRSAKGRRSRRRCSAASELRADHADVPSAVFSQPPIGAVGLTEAPGRRPATAPWMSTRRPSVR